MEDKFLDICFDIFEAGVQVGKKIVKDNINSPKKASAIFEATEFSKIIETIKSKYGISD